MQILKYTLTLNASGALTHTSDVVKGRLISVFIDETPGAMADTIDLTFTGNTTAQALLTATNVTTDTFLYPRTPSQDNAGTDVTFDGTNEIYEPMVIFNEAIKCVVASGTANNKIDVYYAIE